MADFICEAKHTDYEPTEAQWKCPYCGSANFAIEESAEGAHEDCARLHKQDYAICYDRECKGYDGITGTRFASHWKKKLNRVTCPTCKGHGTVKS